MIPSRSKNRFAQNSASKVIFLAFSVWSFFAFMLSVISVSYTHLTLPTTPYV